MLIAGPCVIESEAHAHRHRRCALARDRRGAPACRSSSRRRYDKANRTSVTSFRGPGLDEGLRVLGARQGAARRADPDRHPRAVAGGAAARGRRRAADPGVPLAADRPARRRGADRPRRQHQEGPVPRAATTCGTRSRRSPTPATTRVIVTERGISFGYNNLVVDMRAFPMMRALGYPGRLRRHAQPAAARRRRRRHRRPGRVHRAAGLGRRRRRRRRRVPGSARGAGAREERRAERAAARPARAAAAPADADRRRSRSASAVAR